VRAFELFIAKDARHALALLAEHGAAAKVLAGGTDLLADLKSAADVPGMVSDISRVEDLKGIALTAAGCASAPWSPTPRLCARR